MYLEIPKYPEVAWVEKKINDFASSEEGYRQLIEVNIATHFDIPNNEKISMTRRYIRTEAEPLHRFVSQFLREALDQFMVSKTPEELLTAQKKIKNQQP
jgi:hypothetical protein